MSIAPALVARARRIEAAMPGRRLSGEVCRVPLGETGGTLGAGSGSAVGKLYTSMEFDRAALATLCFII